MVCLGERFPDAAAGGGIILDKLKRGGQLSIPVREQR